MRAPSEDRMRAARGAEALRLWRRLRGLWESGASADRLAEGYRSVSELAASLAGIERLGAGGTVERVA